MLVLFCTWAESLQIGCQEILRSHFGEKASIYENKELAFYSPLPMNIKMFLCLLFIIFLLWEFEAEIHFNIILFLKQIVSFPDPSSKAHSTGLI